MILGLLIAVVPLLALYLALRLNRLRFREEGTLDFRVAVMVQLLQRTKRSRGSDAAESPSVGHPSAQQPSLEEQRAELESLTRRFARGGPRMAIERDLQIPGPAGLIPVRHYRRSPGPDERPVLLYLHGGAFALGSIDTHDNVCRALAAAAECNVLSVGYRLAPEHPYPAAVEDAYAVLCWAAAGGSAAGGGDARGSGASGGDADRLAVCGDSAGGTLAAALCLMARDREGPRIRHQALVYPATDATTIERESYRLYGRGYALDTDQILWAREQYLPNPQDRFLPYASPLLAPDLAGLPPATIVTAEFDVLRDEGQAYAEALRRAKVPVRYECVPGVVHSFVSVQGLLPQARRAVRWIAEDLRRSWSG
ncbi:MAG: alpha/beta hydrolase [Spirochaetales bacterium]|nr:alpha/beta hydrolase [Spirochaetales bacterium]